MYSLQVRFMLAVLAGAALFAAAGAGVGYHLGHEQALNASHETINGLVDAVEKTAAIGAFASDPVLLKEVSDGLARNPLIATVRVVDSKGAVLVQHGTAPIEPLVRLDVVRPLISPFDATEVVGRLQISVDPKSVEAGARGDAQRLALLMAGQAALVALLLYVMAERLVSRPIAQMGLWFRSMQPGSTDRMTVPRGHDHDEIGVLVNSANGLLGANAQALLRERGLRAQVERMEAQYRQIFDSSSAGIFVLDPSGRLINSNPMALRIIGSPMDDLRNLSGDDFLRRAFVRFKRVRTMIEESRQLGKTVTADLEMFQTGVQSRWVHCLISVQDAATSPGLIEGVMYDITARKSEEQSVRIQAEHDVLTGLKNRRGSLAAIERFLDATGTTPACMTFFCIDLDGLKQVNDGYGHAAGDQVLVACADRMRAILRRGTDLVGRMGGDEFIITLENLDCADARSRQIADEILAALGAPIGLEDGRTVRVGASIGIAGYPRNGSTCAQLLSAGDEAMYEVKRSGKNAARLARNPAGAPVRATAPQ
jgi:diguanylate cyclase (GGDEF)-like protein/PAS domain S-box-containing protein